jgi:hypothetical protein
MSCAATAAYEPTAVNAPIAAVTRLDPKTYLIFIPTSRVNLRPALGQNQKLIQQLTLAKPSRSLRFRTMVGGYDRDAPCVVTSFWNEVVVRNAVSRPIYL